MPELKLVINDPKSGKSYSKALDADLAGRKIGEKIDGKLVGLTGYELILTGGSDKSGFPMRKSIEGPNRKSALLGSGTGVHVKRKGIKVRKTVRGNTIGNKISQVHLKITKPGKDSIEKVLGIEKKEEPTDVKKESKEETKEVKKDIKKEEVKEKTEVKTDTPKEEIKK